MEHSSNDYGGAGIYAQEGVAVTLSGASSVWNNNVHKCYGGGIKISHGSTLSLSGTVTVRGNMAYSGGGISSGPKVNITITDSVRFERNVADSSCGGAISFSGCAPSFPLKFCNSDSPHFIGRFTDTTFNSQC